MSKTYRPSIYDRLRPHLDANDLLTRLGVEVVQNLHSEAACRPLCHESTSGSSLHVNLHTGRWLCRACHSLGVSGDLFQLVEYVRSGGKAPSHGIGAMDSPAHRDALEWLCVQYAVPFDDAVEYRNPSLDVVHMVAMMAHRHLLESPSVLEWIKDRWGFDEDIVTQYGIGYLPSPLPPGLLSESKRSEARAAFDGSGLGWYVTGTNEFKTRFEGRVTFPYFVHGRTVYLIGRATDQTPSLDGGAPPPKYHKLAVHSEKRPHISEAITNNHLYNETVLRSADTVIVAEGISDAVALSTLGAPVVSPVTISFNEPDLRRFVKKVHESQIRRVQILFDNELSGSGSAGARRVALKLVAEGIPVQILSIPLGESQEAARRQVEEALGTDDFKRFEKLDPHERKRFLTEKIQDKNQRAWISNQLELSKIDVAEWHHAMGARARTELNAIRKKGVDVVHSEIAELEASLDLENDPTDRAAHFWPIVEIVAALDDALIRDGYAKRIAGAAGKGVTKAEILRRISQHRRDKVKPDRKRARDAEERDETAQSLITDLILPPPMTEVPREPSKKTEGEQPKGVPLPPGAKKAQREASEHEKFAATRDQISRIVDKKGPTEEVGSFVAQVITRSMGFTVFRTEEDTYLIRGNERVAIGYPTKTRSFKTLLLLASGLSPEEAKHRVYIAKTIYFLEMGSLKVHDVSWSHASEEGALYFPTGEKSGRIIKITPGNVSTTDMASAKVPAVAGLNFDPFSYTLADGGVSEMAQLFRGFSMSAGDQTLLLYWVTCLPLMRLVGCVPIVRVEGGSSSGKTRITSAISVLVNGKVTSSVPTSAALASRMSVEMLTIDDNRETIDVSNNLISTLLQATHLGAKEKRQSSSDTGTVVERICGALLMNGVEPIHDGRPELASRMLVLRASTEFRGKDSPRSDVVLNRSIRAARDSFWSESCRLCATALKIDEEHGEHIAEEIEGIFSKSRVGRLSGYLRLMYFAWVAGWAPEDRPELLKGLHSDWVSLFTQGSSTIVSSLGSEELTTEVLNYVFAFGRATAVGAKDSEGEKAALEGKYIWALSPDFQSVEEYLGEIGARQLARFVRSAIRELGGPEKLRTVKAGQLEQRILDGLELISDAGFDVEVRKTQEGKVRFMFRRITSKAFVPEGEPQPGQTEGDIL